MQEFTENTIAQSDFEIMNAQLPLGKLKEKYPTQNTAEANDNNNSLDPDESIEIEQIMSPIFAIF